MCVCVFMHACMCPYPCVCVFNFIAFSPFAAQRDKKLKYAEKMATAYRLSAGLGEFTPEVHKSHETKDSKQGFSSQWMSNDQNSLDDEFDF